VHQAQKVVWSEGMLLGPHHFQQADQYYETLLVERFRQASPFAWGLVEYQMNPDALQSGCVEVLTCYGVMPDGLVIRAPDCDALPDPRPVEGLFTASLERLDVFLGIPAERAEGPNCRLNGGASPSNITRYVAASMEVPDEIVGPNYAGERREILVARTHSKILFSSEDMTGQVTMKIAEIVRTQAGGLAFHDTYIPPCLSIGASSGLMRRLNVLLESLLGKREALTAYVGTAGQGQPDHRSLMLFHALSGAIPVLAHAVAVGRTHPEALYLALCRLAGELSAVPPGFDPRDLPRYAHKDLRSTFSELDLKIRAAIKEEPASRHRSIPLTRQAPPRERVWEGAIPDDHLLQSSELYLVAGGEAQDEPLQAVIAQRVKAATPDEIDVIVGTMVRGLRLIPVSPPPAGLPAKTGCSYFRLEKKGEFWEAICRSHAIAFYVPDDLSKLKWELIAGK
jgi:type VI secretion system protein ImpJ